MRCWQHPGPVGVSLHINASPPPPRPPIPTLFHTHPSPSKYPYQAPSANPGTAAVSRRPSAVPSILE